MIVAKSKKPADNVVQDLLKPTSDLISQAVDYREKHRAKKETFNHLSAVSEGIPGLGWVLVVRLPFFCLFFPFLPFPFLPFPFFVFPSSLFL